MTPTNENETTEGHWAHSLAGDPYTMVWVPARQPEVEDPADYGNRGDPEHERGPDETYCRNCQELALDHTPGRWSIYGVCPTNKKETN